MRSPMLIKIHHSMHHTHVKSSEEGNVTIQLTLSGLLCCQHQLPCLRVSGRFHMPGQAIESLAASVWWPDWNAPYPLALALDLPSPVKPQRWIPAPAEPHDEQGFTVRQCTAVRLPHVDYLLGPMSGLIHPNHLPGPSRTMHVDHALPDAAVAASC